MSNIYSTTLFAGYFLAGTGATLTTVATAGPLIEPSMENRKKRKFAETNDFEGEKNIKVLAENLQLLNPDEEIRILNKNEPHYDQLIFATTTVDNLELPNGFTQTRTGFYTAEDESTHSPINIHVVDMNTIANRDALEEKLQPKFEQEKIHLGNLKYGATTIGCLISTSVFNTVQEFTYADTYDAKAYMDALSNEQLVELATSLENSSMDDLDQMLVEEPVKESPKKLVK